MKEILFNVMEDNHEIKNIKIKLGENAKENWNILKNVNDNYWWLHLDAYPSGHIIIENENPPKEIIEEAMILCKNNTKYKNLKNLYFFMTQIKNLKKGDEIGEVYFKNKKKIKKIKL
jgi:predicted ribosome quality control (RQC) complex YloA/Tae2 family protein